MKNGTKQDTMGQDRTRAEVSRKNKMGQGHPPFKGCPVPFFGTIGEAYTDEVSQNETTEPEVSQMLDLSEAISDLAKLIEHAERK
jgi:hypothetical protein